jgi:hypothetical protein
LQQDIGSAVLGSAPTKGGVSENKTRSAKSKTHIVLSKRFELKLQFKNMGVDPKPRGLLRHNHSIYDHISADPQTMQMCFQYPKTRTIMQSMSHIPLKRNLNFTT